MTSPTLQDILSRLPQQQSPQVSIAGPQMPATPLPDAATPNPPSPNVTPAPAPPGRVKGLLQSILYGAGQALEQHAGIKTDFDRNQESAQLALAQNAQTDNSALKQAQLSVLQQKADLAERMASPYAIAKDDQSVLPQFRGSTTTLSAYQGLQKLSGQSTTQQNVAQTRADAQRDVADTNATSRTAIQQSMLAYRKAIEDRQYGLAQQHLAVARQGLALRSQGLGLRQQQLEAQLYGLDMNGNPLPGSAQITNDDGTQTTVGARFAPVAIKQNANTATFNDLVGSVKNVRAAALDYQKEGGNLSDATIAAAASDPHSTIGKIINGKLVTGGLTPTQIRLVNAQRQLTEQAGILRKTTGGTASEAGAQRILSTVPVFGQDTNESGMDKLDQIDSVLTRLAAGQTTVKGGVGVHPRGNGSIPPSTGPSEGTTKVNAAGDKIVFRGGKWTIQ